MKPLKVVEFDKAHNVQGRRKVLVIGKAIEGPKHTGKKIVVKKLPFTKPGVLEGPLNNIHFTWETWIDAQVDVGSQEVQFPT